MFEILKDSEASVESLSRAYVVAQIFEKKLAGEQSEAHEALMKLQVAHFDQKPSKQLLAQKALVADIRNKLEACQFGREELKARIADRLQVEARGRLEGIAKELGEIASEERALKGQYLDLCAKAALVREKLKGAETSYNGSVLVRLFPDPRFNFQLLDSEDKEIYSGQVAHYRQESSAQNFPETITGRRSTLTEEQTRLEKMLATDPVEEAQRLLDKLSPPKPEPEPEPEGRKTTTIIRDYDKIGPVDYGLGQELPFKSVNEVLHDRQEMKQ